MEFNHTSVVSTMTSPVWTSNKTTKAEVAHEELIVKVPKQSRLLRSNSRHSQLTLDNTYGSITESLVCNSYQTSKDKKKPCTRSQIKDGLTSSNKCSIHPTTLGTTSTKNE